MSFKDKVQAARKLGFSTPPIDNDGILDEPKQAPQSTHKPVEAAKPASATSEAGEDYDLPTGSRKAQPQPVAWDYRSARTTGRHYGIHTNISREHKLRLYRGADKDRKDLCEVLEEMIDARYGKK